MRKLGLLLAGLLVLARAAADPGVPPAAGSDETQRTVSYLGVLSGWKQQLGLVVRACKSVDPSGQADRQTIYEEWQTAHQKDLARADVYLEDIAPRLLTPEQLKGLNPVQAIETNTLIELGKPLFYLPADQKLAMCQGFRGLSVQFAEKSDLEIKDAFLALDRWKRAHPASP